MDHPKMKIIFGRINKSRSSSLKNFLFYQISFWLSYESFFCFACVMLLFKKGPFQLREVWTESKHTKFDQILYFHIF